MAYSVGAGKKIFKINERHFLKNELNHIALINVKQNFAKTTYRYYYG